MPKGGVAIREHVLFGKYRLCRRLGKGRSGTVYLAYHMELEEYRAVKVVPKTMADYDTFRKEALFLKTLRHPGIPLVYDVEEDNENSYLIEEYLEGESLHALVKRLGSLSMKTAVEIGIQICRLILFMNSAENPILYLDLQPKNLLICNGRVRLVDFDHAQYAAEAERLGERYGTLGFAAPEQYSGEPLDCRTDVYAIGALLYYMCRGKPPGREPELGSAGSAWELDRIIRGCMAEKKEERYPNAGEVEVSLKELQTGISKEQAIQSQNIVFAGAQRGIGTTHAALGISNFLTRNGCPALYQEEYDTDTIRTLIKNRKLKEDRTGVYHIGCTNIRPFYGKSVKMPYLFFPIIVKDTGVTWQEGLLLPEADLYVLVCGGKWWETDRTLRAAEQLRKQGTLFLLFNHMPDGIRLKLPPGFRDLPCFMLPFFPDPFKNSQSADACYRELLKTGIGGLGKWEKSRWKPRRWKHKAES